MEDNYIDTEFNIEDYMYLNFKAYMFEKSKFASVLNIYPRSPDTLAKFPTIIFKETNNIDGQRTLDMTQRVEQITDTIEIYTTEAVLDGTRYASKVIQNELKNLVFEFFENCGARRLGCTPAEYSNRQVDRLVITERYSQNNWNRRIF